MVALNFNAQTVPPAEAGLPIWDGVVPVSITRTEALDTSSKDGSKYLALHVRSMLGKFVGQENVIRLNLWNKNAQACDIAQRELSSICHVSGRMALQDSNELVGATFLTIWQKGEREIQDQQTGRTRKIESCECKEYRVADGRTIKELQGGAAPANPFNPAMADGPTASSQPAAPAAPVPTPTQGFQPPAAPQQPGFQPPAGASPQGAPQNATAAPASAGGFAPVQAGGTPQAGGFGTAASPSNGGFGAPAAPAGGGFGQPGPAPTAGGFGPPGGAPQGGGGFGQPSPAGGFGGAPNGTGPWGAQR